MAHIQVDARNKATAFVGKDAALLVRAIKCKHAITLHIRKPGADIAALLKQAKKFTGKTYKVSAAADHKQAVADLSKWISTMQSALPVLDESGKQIR